MNKQNYDYFNMLIQFPTEKISPNMQVQKKQTKDKKDVFP